MPYEMRWHDDPDLWHQVSKTEVMRRAKAFYRDPDAFLASVRETPGAEMRFGPGSSIRFMSDGAIRCPGPHPYVKG